MKTQSFYQGNVQQMVQQYEQKSQCAQQSAPKQTQQASQCSQNGQVKHNVDQFERKNMQHQVAQCRENMNVQHRQFLSLYSRIMAKLQQM